MPLHSKEVKRVGQDLESYKKVFKVLWTTYLEITELRATLPNSSETRSGILPDIKVIDSQAKIVPDNKEVKDQI